MITEIKVKTKVEAGLQDETPGPAGRVRGAPERGEAVRGATHGLLPCPTTSTQGCQAEAGQATHSDLATDRKENEVMHNY